MKRFFSRLLGKVYTICAVRRWQRTTPQGLSFLLQRHRGADTLVVSFPGCTEPAHYNYVATLRSQPCHRLFLLDNYAENGLGNYLMRPDVAQQVLSSIQDTVRELQVKRLFFVGSSKGASSALFFGFQIPDVTLCIAAPQYFIGDYLWDGIVYRKNLADILQEEPTVEGIQSLNASLSNLVLHSSIRPRCIYLHYSDVEHTYAEHVQPLIQDLRQAAVEYQVDVAHYANHADLRFFYPQYLSRILGRFLSLNA